jgi:photosystem II stability/assembly factor-like uncharacterized protein
MRSCRTIVRHGSRLAAGLTVAALLVGPRALAAEEPWVALGPTGEIGDAGIAGRVISLAVDPRNPNHVFAGSASGGLWVSELYDPLHPLYGAFMPGGAAAAGNPRDANWRDDKRPYWRWRHVDTGQPVLGVGAIAIDPQDPDVIYIGTGEVYGYRRTARGFDYQPTRGNYGIGILRSLDGGRTWSRSLAWSPADQTGVQDLAIVPAAPGSGAFTVWAATSEGVYRLDTSRQAGGAPEDWKLSLAVVAATSLSVDPRRPGEVVAACGNFASPGHGLYKTRDGGATWQRVVRGVPVTFQGKGVLARSPSDPDVLYASLGNSTELIFANDSVPAGATPTGGADGSTYPENTRYKCLYTATPLRGPSTWLLRSVDGGDSWETRNEIRDSYNTQGWYVGALAVHPQDPDQLYLGYIGPNRSFDGGRTIEDLVVWKENRLLAQAVYDQENGSLIFVDFHAIRAALADGGILYFACDQGVYRSADGGRTNVRVNQGFNTAQFYRGVSISQRPAERDFIAGVPQDYGVGFLEYHGSAARESWTIEQGWGQEAGFSAYDDRRRVGYFTTHTNRMLGRWQRDACPVSGAPPPGCQPVIDPATAFDPCYIPDVNPFQRSANCLDNSSFNAPLVLAPVKRDRLYAARDVIYRSDQAPQHSWSPEPKANPENACISNAAPGVTWAPTSLGRELDGNPIFALAVAPDDDDHLLAATAPRYGRMNVFRSLDAGSTWQRITYNLPSNAYPMALVFDPNAAHGAVVYLTLGGYGFSHLWKLETGEGKPAAWQDLDARQLPDVWASGLVVDPADHASRHLYVATDQGVYRSADGGRTWQAWSEGLYTGVMSVELLLFAPERLLRLVTHGNGIWQRHLPAL